MSAVGVAAAPAPVVRLAAAGDGPRDALLGATRVLVDQGVIRLAGHGGDADLLHTVGERHRGGGPATRHVHTVGRIPLARHTLVAANGWSWWQRRRTAGCAVVLVHGRTAARVVVAAGVVPGERLHVLPLLAPAGTRVPDGGADVARDRAVRAAVRRRLDVGPGVRLVVGDAGGPSALRGWDAALRDTGRRDVRVADCGPRSTEDLDDLLAAADVVVAADGELLACSPGVAAVRRGVPTVATTTDATAELVDPGHHGYVVPPTVTDVAGAVLALLDGSAPGCRRAETSGRGPATRDLATALERAYRRALALPGRGVRP